MAFAVCAVAALAVAHGASGLSITSPLELESQVIRSGLRVGSMDNRYDQGENKQEYPGVPAEPQWYALRSTPVLGPVLLAI